ncbi:MAG: class I SAM-dependent methyltransferase [Acidobacteria bacterium]|nr:class I SAM-dependent methyltransferase [Acidobacteriota bacterium]
MNKKERAADWIVAACRWLAKRSVRMKLLIELVATRLFVTWQMERRTARPPFTTAELAARTDEFNRASERYFAEQRDVGFLLGKPYSDTLNFARRMFDIGVLAHWLRLSPGEVTAELGAGTCWLSHFLNRFGCRTIAIDVSPTALRMGRELFERDPLTNWDLKPEFLPYDGHRIPLPDGHVDKIVIYDAFHHIPNQAEILREMARVLKAGGVVAMCEPGSGHGAAETSRHEADEWGVLENEFASEELERLALANGFDGVRVIPLALPPSIEIEPAAFRQFLLGYGLRHYWSLWCQALQSISYVVLYKGDFVPTTRRPQSARARIEIEPDRLTLAAGERATLPVRIHNTGDTRWLTEAPNTAGWTRLGAHLHAAAPGAPAIDYDWYRGLLPHDVRPGESVTVDVELPPIEQAGDYRAVFDVVAEGVLWFAQRNSPTAELHIEVRPGRAGAGWSADP